MATSGSECTICSDPYDNPKFLNCGHSFCCKCLQGWARGSKAVTCPECRAELTLPEDGVSGLPTNVSLVRATDELLKDRYGACKFHNGKSLHYYCDTCSKLVCTQGIQLDHATHKTLTAEEKARDLRVKLGEDLLRLDEDMKPIEDLANEWKMADNLKNMNVQEVLHLVDKRRDAIKARAESLSAELHESITKNEQKYVTDSVKYQERLNAELDPRLSLRVDILGLISQDASCHKVIREYDEIHVKSVNSLPPAIADIPHPEWTIFSLALPEGDLNEEVTRIFGELSDATVATKLKHSRGICVSHVRNINGKFRSDKDSSWLRDVAISEEGLILAVDNNNHNVKTFNLDGHLIHVSNAELFDRPIKITSLPGEPDRFLIIDKNRHGCLINWWNLGSQEKTPFLASGTEYPYQDPWALAVCRIEGDTAVAVADRWRNVLLFYTLDGQEKTRWHIASDYIWSIAGHAQQNTLVVTHTGEADLIRAYRDGIEIWTWKPEGEHNLRGLCMTRSGNVVVTDQHTHRVLLVSPHGQLVRTVVSGDRGLSKPMAVTYSEEHQRLAITEENSGVIHLYQCHL